MKTGDIPSNGSVIYLEERHLDDWVSKLKEKGFEFDQAPKDEPYLWREAIFHHPSGTKIKLC